MSKTVGPVGPVQQQLPFDEAFGSDEEDVGVPIDDFHLWVCRALAVLALANGGSLDVAAPPANLGYSIVRKWDGVMAINAALHEE